MIRAVVDTGVLIAGAISAKGAPASILRAWLRGAIELVVCPALLDELVRALAYPKVRRYVSQRDALTLVQALERTALRFSDPAEVIPVCRDPADDYLFALAHVADAVLVSGDRDVLAVQDPGIRVLTPATLASLVGRLSDE